MDRDWRFYGNSSLPADGLVYSELLDVVVQHVLLAGQAVETASKLYIFGHNGTLHTPNLHRPR